MSFYSHHVEANPIRRVGFTVSSPRRASGNGDRHATQQAQTVQNHNDGATFVTDYTYGEVDLFEKCGDYEKRNNPKRDRDVLTNYRALQHV